MIQSISASLRRRVAVAAAVVLAILLLWRNSPRELANRWRTLAAYASRELAVRRLGGSSTAFDRRFFVFLESARRRLPPAAAGVAVAVRDPSESALYLAAYQFAPIPVALAPSSVPSGWLLAVYGPERPSGWKVVAEVPGGALLEPASR